MSSENDQYDWEPCVIDPPDFSASEAWNECREYVDKCGGLSHDDGSVNLRAAHGADPGICGCPACGRTAWAFGIRHRCRTCGFEYPINAWAMFSWGVQAKWHETNPPPAARNKRYAAHMRKEKERRMPHPYYRYGYEHGDQFNRSTRLYETFKTLPWRKIMNNTPHGDGGSDG